MTSSTSAPATANGNGHSAQDRMERRLAGTQRVLIILIAVVVAFPFLFNWWLERSGDAITSLQVSDMHIEGRSTFCPGERVTVDFHFTSKGAGAILEDATWFRLDPPMTVETSQTKTYILAESFQREVFRSWFVPERIIDERTGELIPLPSGQYRRLYEVASKADPAIHSIASVDITVPKVCATP